jgi:hypothetical protein
VKDSVLDDLLDLAVGDRRVLAQLVDGPPGLNGLDESLGRLRHD